MDEIDESYKSITSLEEKLKRVREENSNFCQVRIWFYLTRLQLTNLKTVKTNMTNVMSGSLFPSLQDPYLVAELQSGSYYKI